MKEFFRGWRKKIGVVALLLACLFMAGWVRSHLLSDYVRFKVGGRYQIVFSLRDSIYWWGVPTNRWVVPRNQGRLSLQLGRTPVSHKQLITESINLLHLDVGLREWIIPYWSIVFPLTLISAHLLLTKPRHSTPKNIGEPSTNEGV